MEFSRHEYWSGLPFPSPEDLPDPGIELWSPASKADSLPFELQGSPYRALAIYKAFLKHFWGFHQILGIQMDFTDKSLPAGLPAALIRSMGPPLQCWSPWDAKAGLSDCESGQPHSVFAWHSASIADRFKVACAPVSLRILLRTLLPWRSLIVSFFSVGPKRWPIWDQYGRQTSHYALHFPFSAPRNPWNVSITGPLSPAGASCRLCLWKAPRSSDKSGEIGIPGRLGSDFSHASFQFLPPPQCSEVLWAMRNQSQFHKRGVI